MVVSRAWYFTESPLSYNHYFCCTGAVLEASLSYTEIESFHNRMAISTTVWSFSQLGPEKTVIFTTGRKRQMSFSPTVCEIVILFQRDNHIDVL